MFVLSESPFCSTPSSCAEKLHSLRTQWKTISSAVGKASHDYEQKTEFSPPKVQT